MWTNPLISNSYKQRWIERLPAPRKKVRQIFVSCALLRSRGRDMELYTRYMIGCWNVCRARSGKSGRRRLGGSVHVHWKSCVCWSGPAHRARLPSLFTSPATIRNGRAVWQSPLGRTFLLYTQINRFSGCDLEFGFGSFELKNPLICVYNKNVRPSGGSQTARPLSDCCGRSKNRNGKRAARRAAPAYTRSVHVHRATEPSCPASPAPRLRAVHTIQ